MNNTVVIKDVTYEIHRSFIGDRTIAQRLEEIITKTEPAPDSLTSHTLSQYNTGSGSALKKEVVH